MKNFRNAIPFDRAAGRNLFIMGFLLFVLVDSFPFESRTATRIREWFDPVGDVLGIWQGPWDLFSPAVDKENNRIEAEIYFRGRDEPVLWSSPRWGEAGCLEKFLGSREIEYYDRLRNRNNRAAWQPAAQWLARRFESGDPSRKVSKVVLISVVADIPPPPRADTSPAERREIFHIAEF